MFKLVVMVSGGGTNLQTIINSIESGELSGVEITAVISTNKHAYALQRAKKHKIRTEVFSKKDFVGNKERESALFEFLCDLDVNLVVLCGCLMVFSEEFIKKLKIPIINIHPSLLPDFGGRGFYGLRVHEAVLAAGVKKTGATVHYVDGGIDTGKIILQREVGVLPGDTPQSLQLRVMLEAERWLLPEAVKKIITAVPKRSLKPNLNRNSYKTKTEGRM